MQKIKVWKFWERPQLDIREYAFNKLLEVGASPGYLRPAQDVWVPDQKIAYSIPESNKLLCTQYSLTVL